MRAIYFDMRVSDWLLVPDSECFMRVIEGSDSSVVANRVAFIEKTPRVRVKPWTEEDDWKNWKQGPKGGLEYGRDPDSRIWCNQKLVEMGYAVPDLTRENVVPENFDPDPEYADMTISEILSKNSLNANGYQVTSPDVCLNCKHMLQRSVEDVCQCLLAKFSDKWNHPHVEELGTCNRFERRS